MYFPDSPGAGGGGREVLNLLIGALYVLAGGWLAFFPLAGILTLTVLLALMFIVQGVLDMIVSGCAYLFLPATAGKHA